MWGLLKPETQKVMRVIEKTLYEIIYINKEEKERNKRKIKA